MMVSADRGLAVTRDGMSVKVSDMQPKWHFARHCCCYEHRECAGHLQGSRRSGSRQRNCMRNPTEEAALPRRHGCDRRTIWIVLLFHALTARLTAPTDAMLFGSRVCCFAVA